MLTRASRHAPDTSPWHGLAPPGNRRDSLGTPNTIRWMTGPLPDSVRIFPLSPSSEAEACANLMSNSEPWSTLRVGYDACLRRLQDTTREAFVATAGSDLAGFLILSMNGVLIGFIQTICVAPAFRGRGLGTRMIDFAEQRIFRGSPNAFLCVSSFNSDARRLYERLGYRYVGELTDFLVQGHSELLFRKSRGPWTEFAPPA
jgi:[ribosomal protein S18]-alanine N-acetyltransferase